MNNGKALQAFQEQEKAASYNTVIQYCSKEASYCYMTKRIT